MTSPAPDYRQMRNRRLIEVARAGSWWQVREAGVRVFLSKRRQSEARTYAHDLELAAEVLDRELPKRGQCLLCGVPGEDQTHRVIDAIAERYRAGDGEVEIANDYGVTVEAVAACLTWTMHDRRGVAIQGKLDAIYAQRDTLRSVIRAAIAADPDSTAATILRTADLEAKA